jgi:ferrous iron transport protein B
VKVALIGQPNCGKSTLFNSVAGYRSATGNFSGTTVQLAWSTVRVNGCQLELVDVPGIYSLTATNPTEVAAKQFLLREQVDVIVNVLDASLLSRSLELTLELRELGLPMVVCLNMMDEAQRKGVSISARRLEELLGVPVAVTVAPRGVGVRELFARVLAAAGRIPPPAPALRWHRDVVSVVELMQSRLNNGHRLPTEFVAVKLLEGDEDLRGDVSPAAHAEAERLRAELELTHGRPPESVIMAERHDRAMHLFEQVAAVGRPRADFRERLDAALTHPFWGYAVLAAVLLVFFWGVFSLGAVVEEGLAGRFEGAWERISAGLAPGTLGFAAVKSLWDGFAGGAGILLPYLIPLLAGLAFLEDTGYLPRVAYLLDGLLHRIGLHGTSVLPIVLGYGCSVPACLATRILPSRRDRFLATVLATLVPCSARSMVIFALVAFYLGPGWALAVFGFNAVVVFFSGVLLTRLWPEVSAGMVLEVPRYQWPAPGVMAKKVWLRLREFVTISWPLLVAGSLVLGLAEYFDLTRYANAMLTPLTLVLGLPAVVGVTLVFGILRKELSMLMLVQALGTTDVAAVMTTTQILVFTVFLMFYIPCLATLVTMTRELGRRLTAAAMLYTLLLATGLAFAVRVVLDAIL